MNERPAVGHQGGLIFAIWVLLWQIVGWAIVDVLLFNLFLTRREESVQFELGAPLILGVVVGQLGCLAGWLALGDGRWQLRLAAIVASAFCLTALVGRFFPFHISIITVACLPTGFCGAVASPLLVLRWFGWACRLLEDVALPRRANQFRLSHLLIATTLIACALGSMRVLPAGSIDVVAAGTLVGLVFGIVPWTLWIALLGKHFEHGTFVVLALFLLSTLISFFLLPRLVGPWIVFNSAHFGVLVINLGLLRCCGYRLRRAAGVPATAADSELPK